MLILQTFALFLIFVFLSFMIFYSLGFWGIARRYSILAEQEIIALSCALGVVFFVLLAVFLGLVNLRGLMLPVLIISDIVLVFKFKQKLLIPFRVFAKYKFLLFLIITGILIQGMINIPSGYLYQDGLNFWSSQGHDGLWHVASMEEISKTFPPQNPGFSGESLYNYHYLVDVLMGEFFRIFPFFSSLDLYFRFFPVLFSFMIGISVFSFAVKWQNNHKIGYLALFFIYLVGSFGYIPNYLRGGGILGGETIFWAAQQNTILGNPPHAISHALFPAFLLSILYFFKYRSKDFFFITFLIGCILAGFKVSGGLVLLIGVGCAGLIDIIFNRRFSTFLLAFFLGLSNFITIQSMTRGASSFLMFLPWWFVRTTIVDRLGWMNLEFQREHYLAQHTWHAYLRVVQVEAIAFFIFLFGNMGMRILGFFEIIKRFVFERKEAFKNPIDVLLLGAAFTGFIIPMLFVQRGLIYNNIQFMQYFLLIAGFYGAITVYKLLVFVRKRIFQVVIMTFIIILSVPTVIGNLAEFYGPGRGPLAVISHSELQALKYLKDHSAPTDAILNVPFNKYLQDRFKTQPKPIYAWYDTPYISALTNRRSYLASEHVTLLDYPDTKLRQENMLKFFKQEDFAWNKQFLKTSKINFIYVNKPELEIPLNLDKNNLALFYENDEVLIYKVERDE